jgi:hypothetical protein
MKLNKILWAWDDESHFMYGELNGFDSDPEQMYKYQIGDSWFKNVSDEPPPHAVRVIGQVKLDNSPTGTKPFPTLEEFEHWWNAEPVSDTIGFLERIRNYFKAFKTIEVMPEVGKEYEFSHYGEKWFHGVFKGFVASGHREFKHIRPIQTPTREEIIEKSRRVLTEEEIAILTGG